MDWCKKQMKHFDYDTRMSYYINNFYNDTSIYMDPNFHTRALVDRARYYRYATQCVNYELKNKYDLMAESQIRYCITNQDNIQRTFGKLTITKQNKTYSLCNTFQLIYHFSSFLHHSLSLSLFFSTFFPRVCRHSWLVLRRGLRDDCCSGVLVNELRFPLETQQFTTFVQSWTLQTKRRWQCL